MRLRVHHRTVYFYADSVTDSVNEVRLCPLNTKWQRCESSTIAVLPAVSIRSYEDLNCNTVHRFEIPEPHLRLVIDSRAVVRTRSKVDFEHFPYGFSHDDLSYCKGMEECYPFLQNSNYVDVNPDIWREAVDIQDDSDDVFQTGYQIMEYIFANYDYRPGVTTVSTHATDVIRNKHGVCQDFAHAMVAFCRSLGIPARYVSGYIYDPTIDHSLRGSQASHAWVEIYIRKFGWIGLDPTNRKVVDDTYIVLANGRDYREVAPVIGTFYGSGRSSLKVLVKVDRLDSNERPVGFSDEEIQEADSRESV